MAWPSTAKGGLTQTPPKIHSPPGDFYTDYPDSQIPLWDDDYSLAELGQADPDYPFEAYIKKLVSG